MLRIFQKTPIRNGRWATNKTFEETMRAVDLANSDSCYVSETPKYVHIDNDVIEFDLPLAGGFELHSKNYNRVDRNSLK